MTVLFRQVFVYDAAARDAMTGPTDVLIEDDRISAVGDGMAASPGARIVEGGGRHLLVPGLINAHFHSPANHLKGSVRSLPLELFMLFESPADPAMAPARGRPTCGPCSGRSRCCNGASPACRTTPS